MLLEFHNLLTRGDKEALFKLCLNRCYAAFCVVYEYEKAKAGTLWNFDECYHKQCIELLYERFSYAMAIIVACFAKESSALDGLIEGSRKATTLSVCLSGAVDEVFKLILRDMAFTDATIAYWETDFFDDEYESFWQEHPNFAQEVTAVRMGFHQEERTFLHGFIGDNDDDDNTENRDCLHIMRACQKWREVDIAKFLNAAKREYLPMIIRLFLAEPKQDIFSAKPNAKWWEFWKRAKRA